MKKVLALALGMLLIPFSAFGMQTMSEADMDSITGQTGVAISLNNIQIYSNSEGSELWYETGLAGDSSLAAVGIVYGDSPSYMFLNAISAPAALGIAADDGAYGGESTGAAASGGANALLRGDYSALEAGEPLAAGISGMGPRQNPSVLSIRVAQHNAVGIFGPIELGTGGYVEIGLATLEIVNAAGSYDSLRIYVMGEDSYNATTDGPILSGLDSNQRYSLGSIYTTDAGATTAILGGRIGITSLGQVPQANTSSGLADDLTEASPL